MVVICKCCVYRFPLKTSSCRFEDNENLMREALFTHSLFTPCKNTGFIKASVPGCYEVTTLTNQFHTAHCAGISPQAQHAQSMKLIWRPLDLILVLLLLAAMAFTILRGLVSVHHIHVMDGVWGETVRTALKLMQSCVSRGRKGFKQYVFNKKYIHLIEPHGNVADGSVTFTGQIQGWCRSSYLTLCKNANKRVPQNVELFL